VETDYENGRIHAWGGELIHLLLTTKPRTNARQDEESKRQQKYLSTKQCKTISMCVTNLFTISIHAGKNTALPVSYGY